VRCVRACRGQLSLSCVHVGMVELPPSGGVAGVPTSVRPVRLGRTLRVPQMIDALSIPCAARRGNRRVPAAPRRALDMRRPSVAHCCGRVTEGMWPHPHQSRDTGR
jgi:hypothetical protein